jgi:hypothetical protein
MKPGWDTRVYKLVGGHFPGQHVNPDACMVCHLYLNLAHYTFSHVSATGQHLFQMDCDYHRDSSADFMPQKT